MMRNWTCNPLTAYLRFLVIVIFLLVQVAPPLMAQTATAAVTGTVRDESGKAVASVTVTATNIDTGQKQMANTGPEGTYKLELPAGNYRLTFEAAGFNALEISSAMVSGTVPEVLDGKLERGEPVNGNPAPTQQENLPNAPSSSATAPSLSDLGLSPEQTQGNAREQALLDKRTHMLKIHQRMGLITTIPLIATVAIAFNAIRAPRVPGTETRGPIRFHKAMAWIHGPGMILTPILGILAFDQKNNGEKVHGIASAHNPVAIVTAGAFGAALLSVSVKF